MTLASSFAIACAAAALATAPVSAGQTTRPQPPPAVTSPQSGPESADIEFVKKATDGGMKEVEAGTLAAEKAANAEVKAFAKQLVDDHAKANSELLAMASLQTPATPPTPPSTPTVDVLSTLSGAAFDRAYIDRMVTDHEASVELYTAQARDGKDDALRKWASEKLPTLRGHLEKARALQAKLGQTSSR